MTRHHSRDGVRLCALAAAIAMSIAAVPVRAETGSANAKDVSVHINLLGIAALDVDPQVPVGFDNVTDPTYQQDSLPSLDTGGTLLHLSTGSITTEAQYAPGVSFSAAGADVMIQNVDLSAVSVLGDSLLSITADVIQSRSQVAGYCLPAARQARAPIDGIMFFNGFDQGNLIPGGVGGTPGDGTKLEGLGISILGIPVPGIPLNPPPNTTIDLGQLGIVGATLILNEQTIAGDGVNSSSLSTNAMHLTMDVAGLVTADVLFAHSDSKLDCTR